MSRVETRICDEKSRSRAPIEPPSGSWTAVKQTLDGGARQGGVELGDTYIKIYLLGDKLSRHQLRRFRGNGGDKSVLEEECEHSWYLAY